MDHLGRLLEVIVEVSIDIHGTRCMFRTITLMKFLICRRTKNEEEGPWYPGFFFFLEGEGSCMGIAKRSCG